MERNIPITERNVPSTERNIPITERSIPITERSIPSTERDVPSTERDIPTQKSIAVIQGIFVLYLPMKEKIISILLFVFSVSGYAQTTFQKAYGSAGDETGGAFSKTVDGGYIQVGSTSAGSAGDYDVYVVKTDSDGVIQWTKTYGGPNIDVGSYIAPTVDSGYIITGYTIENVVQNRVLLLKISKDGTYQWSKSYGLNYDFGQYAQQTSDKGYIVAGSSGSNSVYMNIYTFKTDSLGNLQWTKRITGGGDDSYGSIIKQMPDGGYMLLGSYAYNAASRVVIYLAKIAPTDTVIWEQYYFFTGGNSYGMSFEQTTHKGFIITGNNGSGACLFKTDSAGNLQWVKTYAWTGNKDEIGTCVKQTKDGGYALAGHYESGETNTWLIKTDSLGSLKWAKTYGTGSNLIYALIQNKDGGYTMGGQTGDFGSGGKDFHLLKTDSLGTSNCNELVFIPSVTIPICYGFGGNAKDTFGLAYDTVFVENTLGTETVLCYETIGIGKFISQNLISIYPNPNTGSFVLEPNSTTKQTMQVYDVNGKLVLSQSINGKTTIDASSLNEGVYNISIISSEDVINKRLVIVH